MDQIDSMYPENKVEMYELLLVQLKAMLEGEQDVIANLSNVSALLNQALKDINWVGFYLMKKGSLILGPFQGKVACIHIPVGRGVCGTAVNEGKTQIVKDVHEFPGHIACDSASNSEIVIPMKKNGTILGVLDIDSPKFHRFDEVDAEYLEQIITLLVECCDWPSSIQYDFC
ncbi:GAF domain-containing protein [Lachnoclostridium phytofermentans]|uniref:GAF domain protein n=1 Tax=Lachnoclostridium phytofermentans (strain ATCC 700394 / DSM 18823 / ISDg) TaxID=357809 RepID=A9KID5_LACP7|nr:GAF domain-containing protein [Lachnoclostridium phytofermentans]ABX42387.1 GAF domain protein [Lachnoclostridium phytofermentans ISDg]